jgi:hypothetical protein
MVTRTSPSTGSPSEKLNRPREGLGMGGESASAVGVVPASSQMSQKCAGVALLRGAGDPFEKSASLLFVSSQPPLSRNPASMTLVAPAGEVSEQFATP